MDREQKRKELEHDFERCVRFKDEDILPREKARYEWASKYVKPGDKVLEIGCSNGYGTRLLPKNINYHGIDYDETIVKEARKEYGDENHGFEHADATKYEYGQYDVIIAFEVIEHIDSGLELLKILKSHCKTLLASVPRDEPPGLWGEHHKLHHLKEEMFPGFAINYVNVDGKLITRPDGPINLMLLKHGQNVLATISTRGRYHTTLPLALMGIINQSRLPEKLVIFDDNEKKEDLRDIPTYRHIFQTLDKKGIAWEVVFGEAKGQHYNHEKANRMGFEWVWRVDDDCVPEYDVLEKLMAVAGPDVGAVGSSIIVPGLEIEEWQKGKNEIGDMLTYNVQWYPIKETSEVDHLHCSFIYRSGIYPYNLALSRIAHTEETQFTNGIKNEGYKVLVTPGTSWHLKNPDGGIRDGSKDMFDHDEAIFLKLLEYGKICVLNNGLGDHIVFSEVLPEIEKKYGNVTIACCYPEVFEGKRIISIAEAESLLGNLDHWNVYKRMTDWNWTESLEKAFRKTYLGTK